MQLNWGCPASSLTQGEDTKASPFIYYRAEVYGLTESPTQDDTGIL
jgi:hypothetical protein